MSKSEEPTNQCDGCRLNLPIDGNGNHYHPDKDNDDWSRLHMRCTAHKYEQPSTPPSPEDLYGRGIDSEIVKSQLEFRQKMSPPPSPVEATVQSAYDWVTENFEEQPIGWVRRKVGQFDYDPRTTVHHIAHEYASSLTAEKDAKIAAQAEEIEELKKMIAERNAMYEDMLERADVRAESLELQLSVQRALMGGVEVALREAVNELEHSGLCADHPSVIAPRAVLAKLGKKEKENGLVNG